MAQFLSILFWALWGVNFVAPLPGIWADIVRLLGATILLVHVAEVGIFWRRIKRTPNPTYHIAFILLFGIFHGRTLPKPD